MQVEIKIDDSCTEPKVIILTDKVTDEINDILNTLSSKTPEVHRLFQRFGGDFIA